MGPLGVLSMIDDGELDWKLIAIASTDAHAADINDVDDIEKYYPGTVSGIREWFRWYKTPDDKPVNAFGHGEKALGAAEAVKVIEETHGFYNDLVSGRPRRASSGCRRLWLPKRAAVALVAPLLLSSWSPAGRYVRARGLGRRARAAQSPPSSQSRRGSSCLCAYYKLESLQSSKK